MSSYQQQKLWLPKKTKKVDKNMNIGRNVYTYYK